MSMTTESPNIPDKKSERARGFKDGFQKFELLRAKWPKAFPLKSHEVRPLVNSASQGLMDEFGWSVGYARGVLAAWKTRHVYCQAVLCYPTRINLDGSASDDKVSESSREQAKTQLEQQAALKAKKAERERLRAAAEANAEPKTPTPTPEAPATVIPAEKPAAPNDPPKSGKLLVAGSAAMQAALKRRLASGSITTEVLKTIPTTRPTGKREQRTR
jgi:sRNA-binding protein